MLKREEAKEMSKFIVLGLNHYDSMKDKINFVSNVLEKYNLVEKVKLNDKIMGNTQRIKTDLALNEDKEDIDNDIAL